MHLGLGALPWGLIVAQDSGFISVLDEATFHFGAHYVLLHFTCYRHGKSLYKANMFRDFIVRYFPVAEGFHIPSVSVLVEATDTHAHNSSP